MSKRRAALEHLKLDSIDPQNGTHPGLWLDRYLTEAKVGAEGKWIGTVVSYKMLHRHTLYDQFYGRWEKALKSDAELYEVELKRFIIGLGEANVLQTGITLHHTYGVPYLTGSAVKGLAAACARKYLGENKKEGSQSETPEIIGDPRWNREGVLYRTLFGDSNTGAGIVQFEDALPLCNKWELHQETMTPHHQEYYNGGNTPALPPADWESPNPISYISASGTFLFALRGPQEWCDVALMILHEGLQREGIGAKTSSGYGRGGARQKELGTILKDKRKAEGQKREEELRKKSLSPFELKKEEILAGKQDTKTPDAIELINKYSEFDGFEEEERQALARELKEWLMSNSKWITQSKKPQKDKDYARTRKLMEILGEA